MRARVALHVLVVLAAAATSAEPALELPRDAGTAELPLGVLLRLQQDLLARPAPASEPPPFRGMVDRLELNASARDELMSAVARIQVTVLDGAGWVTVPLLELDESTTLTSLPPLESGALAVRDGWLTLVTSRAGTTTLEVALRSTARVNGDDREASVGVGNATLCTLALIGDPSRFRLVRPEPDEVATPVAGRLVARWRRVASAPAAMDAAPEAAAPTIEPAVVAARASTSLTLEGRRFTRLAEHLRLGRREIIAFVVPAGQTLEHVYVNGKLVAYEVKDARLELPVEPSSLDEQVATVELVLGSQDAAYPLVGTLVFELPSTPWTVHELTWELRLPDVYNYRWVGGTLEPVAEVPAAEFSHPLPSSGKSLGFAQHLIAGSAPRLQVEHSIDLTGHYHCPARVGR
jgi:hypothetical protein